MKNHEELKNHHYRFLADKKIYVETKFKLENSTGRESSGTGRDGTKNYARETMHFNKRLFSKKITCKHNEHFIVYIGTKNVCFIK